MITMITMNTMNEAKNMFVSSRGILKSCNYYSLSAPISSITKLINYPAVASIKTIKTPTLYICGSALSDFISSKLPQITFKFILVSGDCDETIPYDSINKTAFIKLINNPYLVHWFSQNVVVTHEKITIIPIGLDYHTMTRSTIFGPITNCSLQEKQLLQIHANAKPFYERSYKCYANFHFSMNNKYCFDRRDALAQIPEALVVYEKNKCYRIDTWKKQTEFAFVISPFGGGLDCHRTWEALMLNCIPIVKSSKIDNLYKELPVLIVNDWSTLSQELLESTIIDYKQKYEAKLFNYNKLRLNWWMNLINSYK